MTPYVLLFSCVSSAALTEPEICYVLDGILFLYGIILTALYCRIKVCIDIHGQERTFFYGLTPHAQDTYESIGMKK
uniref:Uncharacterized protein n=1 Tax=Monopterus albus TaxID=43700 RepID=A0A3Q3IK24_MONAL